MHNYIFTSKIKELSTPNYVIIYKNNYFSFMGQIGWLFNQGIYYNWQGGSIRSQIDKRYLEEFLK